jgi:hypothetical protein
METSYHFYFFWNFLYGLQFILEIVRRAGGLLSDKKVADKVIAAGQAFFLLLL